VKPSAPIKQPIVLIALMRETGVAESRRRQQRKGATQRVEGEAEHR
jgi:hypothetical protein